MAKIVGVVSGVLGIAQLAFQSSLILYEKVESFKDAPYKVRDLRDELKCLVDVLETLSQTAQDSEIKLDSLELPLRIRTELAKASRSLLTEILPVRPVEKLVKSTGLSYSTKEMISRNSRKS